MADPKRDVLEGIGGYTPGPWEADTRQDPYGPLHGVRAGGGARRHRRVATCTHSARTQRPSKNLGREQSANAQLIARAPELVEEIRALRAMISELDDAYSDGSEAELWREARALLPDTGDET